MINVTKTYLPPFETYSSLVKEAWDLGWITNNGSLLLRLEKELKQALGVDTLWMCSNGTVVLQMALQAVEARGGEIITTPFSYVATSNAISWEGCRPIFTDIDPVSFNIDASKIEALITEKTRAILATHVFGFACDISAIDTIAAKYGIPVIYDGAHSFGAMLNGRSLLSYGDVSTCSFHATKLYHTVEGGCVIARDATISRKLELSRQFGHVGDNYYSVGINGKNSEMHAAMGLALLPLVPGLIAERKNIFEHYREELQGLPLRMVKPGSISGHDWNYSYFPVLFETETAMQAVKLGLESENIFPRRYFFPALNTLIFYGAYQACPMAESIASRILCLPFYNGLELKTIFRISKLIKKQLSLF